MTRNVLEHGCHNYRLIGLMMGITPTRAGVAPEAAWRSLGAGSFPTLQVRFTRVDDARRALRRSCASAYLSRCSDACCDPRMIPVRARRY